MLQISRNDVQLGEVYCLHLPGDPLPDLNSEDCPWVKPLLSGSLRTNFFACKKDGRLDQSPMPWGGMRVSSINPALEVTFIPAIQLAWNDVRVRDEDKKYVAYSPSGVMLVRLTGRNVHFRQPDGSPDTIGDLHSRLIYRPNSRRFTLTHGTVPEDAQDILRAFADQQKCVVDEIVFTPCS